MKNAEVIEVLLKRCCVKREPLDVAGMCFSDSGKKICDAPRTRVDASQARHCGLPPVHNINESTHSCQGIRR